METPDGLCKIIDCGFAVGHGCELTCVFAIPHCAHPIALGLQHTLTGSSVNALSA